MHRDEQGIVSALQKYGLQGGKEIHKQMASVHEISEDKVTSEKLTGRDGDLRGCDG